MSKKAAENSKIVQLNDQFFDGRLSQTVISQLSNLVNEEPSHYRFLEDAFAIMENSHFYAADFSSELAKEICGIINDSTDGAHLLRTSRYLDLDELMNELPNITGKTDRILLDLGCGFPPTGAQESSMRLNGWHIVAMDEGFPEYVLYTSNNDYAFIDGSENIYNISKKSKTTKSELEKTFNKLKTICHSQNFRLRGVEIDGSKLLYRPWQVLQSSNLSLLSQKVGSDIWEKFDFIRGMNLSNNLFPENRKSFLKWLAGHMENGAYAILGFNGLNSTYYRYSLYQKSETDLNEIEFCFSIDNLRSISAVPWSFYDGKDKETIELSYLVGLIRDDKSFRIDFDRRLDELLKEANLFTRDNKGYLKGLGNTSFLYPNAYRIRKQLEREGFLSQAVDLINCFGIRAAINEVGHISIFKG